MVLLKLLSYGIGSVVIYWGLLLLVLALWVFLLLWVVLTNALWNRITGKTDEWKWFLNWTESIVHLIQQPEFEWMGWIPGLIIQIWYAGYAANLVQSSALEKTVLESIVLQSIGVMGMVVAAVIFYLLYRLVVEVKLSKWVYGLVSGISLVAYFVFLQQPKIAQELSESWQKIFATLLSSILV